MSGGWPRIDPAWWAWEHRPGLSLMATSRSRNSSPVATGKNFTARITMFTSAPPGTWNLMAMPLGLEGAPSGTDGKPPSLEKRTVTGMRLPSKSVARLNTDAAGVATKLPSATTPLAWLTRKPGWVPSIL